MFCPAFSNSDFSGNLLKPASDVFRQPVTFLIIYCWWFGFFPESYGSADDLKLAVTPNNDGAPFSLLYQHPGNHLPERVEKDHLSITLSHPSNGKHNSIYWNIPWMQNKATFGNICFSASEFNHSQALERFPPGI